MINVLKPFIVMLLILFSCALSANDKLDQTLDNFHQAASEADFERYFSLLAEESIFLGTDATERWTKQQFAEYVKPYFARGQGWTYVSTERNFSPIAGTNLVFFDELLENDNYGQCRGTGVLRLNNGQWQILQYNLSVMVPNQLAKSVVSLIQGKQ
ncbi:nuclear transport factor 2 family protein [Thalassotalea sp. G2M2-11]|uniref:nuclear transport factor 2 family protein n=1 Tax=Thalassotalea sp. G2M2-11 TaxID=2787627 RepID=UPI0019D030B2|nr:nuclear transport factor 2 family protein [Thalassotalea sp. G2M2-11]